MNLDIVFGFGSWTLLFLGAVAFGAIGLWVDAARQRAIREQQRRSMAGGRGPHEQAVQD